MKIVCNNDIIFLLLPPDTYQVLFGPVCDPNTTRWTTQIAWYCEQTNNAQVQMAFFFDRGTLRWKARFIRGRRVCLKELELNCFEFIRTVQRNWKWLTLATAFVSALIILVHPGYTWHMPHRCRYDDICEPDRQVVRVLPLVSLLSNIFSFNFCFFFFFVSFLLLLFCAGTRQSVLNFRGWGFYQPDGKIGHAGPAIQEYGAKFPFENAIVEVNNSHGMLSPQKLRHERQILLTFLFFNEIYIYIYIYTGPH